MDAKGALAAGAGAAQPGAARAPEAAAAKPSPWLTAFYDPVAGAAAVSACMSLVDVEGTGETQLVLGASRGRACAPASPAPAHSAGQP